MDEEPKDIVKNAYDQIANWYLDYAENNVSPRQRYAKKVLQASGNSPRILELGCGPGVPITRLLLDGGAEVVANDISEKQISLAKARCPEATLIAGDMLQLSFDNDSFDGATCFFAIFHLPRAEQGNMLSKIFSWLKPGSLFALNFATEDEEEIHGEMMGHGMFWSSFDVDHSKAMMMDVGFEILEPEILEAGEGNLKEDDFDYGVKFCWVAARKPRASE